MLEDVTAVSIESRPQMRWPTARPPTRSVAAYERALRQVLVASAHAGVASTGAPGPAGGMKTAGPHAPAASTNAVARAARRITSPPVPGRGLACAEPLRDRTRFGHPRGRGRKRPPLPYISSAGSTDRRA